jgi:hypothetical protein
VLQKGERRGIGGNTVFLAEIDTANREGLGRQGGSPKKRVTYERRLTMKIWKKTGMVATAAILFMMFVCMPAFGQQKYVLKFNRVLGQKEPYHQGFMNWAKAVDEKTKGGLKIEVFHSAQLGVEEDIIEQIRAGAARIAGEGRSSKGDRRLS